MIIQQRIMKSFLISILISFFGLVSCTAQQSPEEVAKNYLKEIDHFNFEKARAFVIPNEKNLESLKNMKKFSQQMSSAEKEEYKTRRKDYAFQTDETDSTATVTATNN
jgi:predicted deacetylase